MPPKYVVVGLNPPEKTDLKEMILTRRWFGETGSRYGNDVVKGLGNVSNSLHRCRESVRNSRPVVSTGRVVLLTDDPIRI